MKADLRDSLGLKRARVADIDPSAATSRSHSICNCSGFAPSSLLCRSAVTVTFWEPGSCFLEVTVCEKRTMPCGRAESSIWCRSLQCKLHINCSHSAP